MLFERPRLRRRAHGLATHAVRLAGSVCPTLGLLLALSNPAAAVGPVVSQGYLTLTDGTQLKYTLTLPSATGRFPVVLEYDPYIAGTTSDPQFAPNGYAFLGVNFRGTGCSQGVFQPLRSDIWGRDGAAVVDWASRQGWSTGNVGMFGGSFTGVSQIATAEHAGSALKAIMPWNIFPDLYRDLVHPGGIYNSWIAAWVGGGRQFVLGMNNFQDIPNDPTCAVNEAAQLPWTESQTADTAVHSYLDGYWSTQPASFADRIRVPVLGCVDWQDQTVYSHAFNFFRRLDPRATWLLGGDGAHTDCSMSHNFMVRFLDRYLKHQSNSWEKTPHLVLAHETPTPSPGPGLRPDNAAAWTTSNQTWSDVNRAIQRVMLHLRAGEQLSLKAPTRAEPPDSYTYGGETNNTPHDWAGNSAWNTPAIAGHAISFTTPRLGRDVEFLGSGSANLWIAASAPDSDVQLTLSEIRPDGQEQYVEGGWLRLSHRKVDPRLSTALVPVHTDRQSDAQALVPGVPVLARIELEPFNHVFRASSAIRLTIDTPGKWFAAYPAGTQNSVLHALTADSTLVLGRVAGVAHDPLPACDKILNQPCRPATGSVAPGTIDLSAPPASMRSVQGHPGTAPASAR